MTGAAQRRVGTLRLSARREELARRGALLFEDALRTASLRGAGPGRVLLLRKLDIGVIRADLPPASVALMLEQKVRALASSAVHGDVREAERADVVFFLDEVEPFVTLARRVCLGEGTDAWYWPLAAPGFVPGLPRDEALRLALRGVMETGAGSLGAAMLLELLSSVEGAIAPLLLALRWQDGQALVRALGGAASSVPVKFFAAHEQNAAAALVRSSEFRRTIARFAAGWGPSDPRSVWLAAMALVIEAPGRLGDTRLTERAAAVAAAIVETNARAAGQTRRAGPRVSSEDAGEGAVPRKLGQTPAVESTGAISQIFLEGARSKREATRNPGEGAEARVRTEADKPTSDANDEAVVRRVAGGVSSDEPEAEATTALRSEVVIAATPEKESEAEVVLGVTQNARKARFWGDGYAWPTVVGGLFFLIPVLERLGIAARLEADPRLFDVALAAQFFRTVARHFGAPPEDAVFLALGDPSGADLEDDGTRTEVKRLCVELLVEARRFCRRNLRIGLRDIVCRSGRIASTRTHVDVIFGVEQADLRVRRAGLDVDPGWVPWFGRVFRYHYLSGEHDA